MPAFEIEPASQAAALPLVIRPGNGDGLASLVRHERERLTHLLLKHGALLFRGFGAWRSEDLARVVEADGAAPMRYFGGISPRRAVAESVYTATDLPPGVHIPLHSELSYLAVYPRRLWFSCVLPATRGGETLLADTRAVYHRLDPRVRALFVDRGVRYECSFHGESLLHDLLERFARVTKSWMDAFETDDRRVVEQRCREIGATPHWLESGRLVLETTRPAAVTHPVTGEPVWFNSAHLFHINPRGIGWSRYLLSRLYTLRPEARTHEATYGDGTPIDDDTLAHVFDVLEGATVAVRWRRGDVLWIDNLLCMHGRNPFQGERRVLAALTQ
jgi:alpha-ketoglutarate-dependent taurine dioxygenase